MDIGEILKQARELRGFSQETLAKTVGVTRQTLYRWESGDSVGRAQVAKLSEILNIDLNYYIQNNILPGPSVLNEGPATYQPNLSTNPKTYVVNYANNEPEDSPVAFVNVPEFDNCVKFVVNDDSMATTLFNGELMVARKAEFKEYFRPNRVYLCQLRDGFTISRVTQSQKEGFLTFKHDNDFYPSYDVPVAAIQEMFLYVGKVARSDLKGIQLTSKLEDLENQIAEIMEKAS